MAQGGIGSTAQRIVRRKRNYPGRELSRMRLLSLGKGIKLWRKYAKSVDSLYLMAVPAGESIAQILVGRGRKGPGIKPRKKGDRHGITLGRWADE